MDRITRILAGVTLSAAFATVPRVAIAASASSDALILLDPDGRHFTVQYTIASDGPAIALELPTDSQPLQVSFLGPNKNAHEENFAAQPAPVQLWDGVALVRYQDQYTEEVTQTGPHSYRLTLPSLPMNFAVEKGDISRSSFTWVFPESMELISYSTLADDVGAWQLTDNELSYEQTDRFAITLTIEYRTKDEFIDPSNSTPDTSIGNDPLATDVFCVPTQADPDRCAADTDQDGVPDYRDVCLSAQESTTNQEDDEPPALYATNDTTALPTDDADEGLSLGCSDDNNLILSEVQFQSGYSYLDVQSRESLDRLAQALRRSKHFFELGAHTDNTGGSKTNLALSEKRAKTIRYYLLLRGVEPNQIRSKGYGEQFPVADNATPEGRQTNRRVEVTLLQ